MSMGIAFHLDNDERGYEVSTEHQVTVDHTGSVYVSVGVSLGETELAVYGSKPGDLERIGERFLKAAADLRKGQDTLRADQARQAQAS